MIIQNVTRVCILKTATNLHDVIGLKLHKKYCKLRIYLMYYFMAYAMTQLSFAT